MDRVEDQREPVEQIAEEFLARYRTGERPALTEYVQRHPGLADEIRDLFPALVMIEEASPGQRQAQEPEGTDLSEASSLDRIGDYKILREVARGGMGIVYEA